MLDAMTPTKILKCMGRELSTIIRYNSFWETKLRKRYLGSRMVAYVVGTSEK